MPYGVGAFRYNEPITRQGNLYPTVNYRMWPPGLHGCASCGGLGADAGGSSGLLKLAMGLFGGWATKKITGSLLLGLAGGYVFYKTAGMIALTPPLIATTSDTNPPAGDPTEFGCKSAWRQLADRTWSCDT